VVRGRDRKGYADEENVARPQANEFTVPNLRLPAEATAMRGAHPGHRFVTSKEFRDDLIRSANIAHANRANAMALATENAASPEHLDNLQTLIARAEWLVPIWVTEDGEIRVGVNEAQFAPIPLADGSVFSFDGKTLPGPEESVRVVDALKRADNPAAQPSALKQQWEATPPTGQVLLGTLHFHPRVPGSGRSSPLPSAPDFRSFITDASQALPDRDWMLLTAAEDAPDKVFGFFAAAGTQIRDSDALPYHSAAAWSYAGNQRALLAAGVTLLTVPVNASEPFFVPAASRPAQ
jgi:hypothetical protein